MKVALVLIAACACIATATAQTYVNPYQKKDGTFVPGHVRSAPNNTVDDNYGTRGNYNPSTGQAGTQRPSYERPYEPPRQPVCGIASNGQQFCR